MNPTNEVNSISNLVESAAATAVTGGLITATQLDLIHKWLGVLGLLLSAAWWIRLHLCHPAVNPPKDDSQTPRSGVDSRLLLAPLLLTLFSAVGCTTQFTELHQYNEAGEITARTYIKTRCFFDSKSDLAHLTTKNQDKSQTVGIDGLSQEASGTNAVALGKVIAQGIVEGLVKSAAPIP